MHKCGGCASAIERFGPNVERSGLTTAVRYGKMGLVGEFGYSPNLAFTCGGKLVISTDRGLEIGEHVNLTCAGCEQGISREAMQAYAQASNSEETYRTRNGRILRQATAADLAEFRHIQGTATEKLGMARTLAEEFGLEIRIVDCEQILGGERVIFYFMSEQRVDFRQLVRQLASEFQTRIEMRQVGARDEARLLADFETCGRECCCRNFLKTLKPITMSMAKLQKTTLDLAKVSGRCGRLKCCLRFEHETYESLNKKLPRNNTWIRTSVGVGKIIDRQVLTQLVKIRTEDDRLEVVPVEDILETGLPVPPPKPATEEKSESAGQRRPERPSARRRPPPPPQPARTAEQEPEPPEDPSAEESAEDAKPPNGLSEPPSADGSTPAEPRPGRPPGAPGRRRRNRRGRRPRHKGRGDQQDGSGGPNPGGGTT
jgi:cell fate regulator YaaT (PSP1 superfamily)